MGINIIILPFIFVPLFNTERIWKSKPCMFEPWLCIDSFKLPQNDFIQNKYDVKVFNYYPINGSGSASFTHLATGTVYTFVVNLTVEDNTASTTFKMKPGNYSFRFVYGLPFHYELWEHGIIPYGYDFFIYLGIEIFAVIIILVSFKYFLTNKGAELIS